MTADARSFVDRKGRRLYTLTVTPPSASDPEHQPPIVALSTMWSQGRFPRRGPEGDDMLAFAQTATRLGFSYVEISYVIPPDGVEQLITTDEIAVASLHSPAPRIKTANGRLSDALNLASLDQSERALAVQRAQATIDHAARARAGYIVVHLGGIGSAVFDEERQLRRLYDEGVHGGEAVDELRRQALDRRREGASRHLSEARRSLAEMAEYAARFGVAIGLENRYHYHEIPSIDEMHELLADYPPDLVGFWLDVGHAEVMDRLGLTANQRWLNELAGRCLGAHVHDVDHLTDHRAPGHGTADWAHLARRLPPHVPRIFEINQLTPEDQVAASIPFLRGRGVLPSSPLTTTATHG